MYVNENQENLLKRFNLSEYHSYNVLLNNFHGEESTKDKIQNIFDFFCQEVGLDSRVTISGVFYSFMGCSFSAEFKNNSITFDLHLKDLTRGEGNRGVIDYYLFALHQDKTINTWDEAFTLVTKYKGDVPKIPFISGDTLLTIISPIEKSINNHRPTFINKTTLNDKNSKITCSVLTVSGTKELTLENNVHDELGVIESITVQVDNNEPVHFDSSHAILDFLEELVHA